MRRARKRLLGELNDLGRMQFRPSVAYFDVSHESTGCGTRPSGVRGVALAAPTEGPGRASARRSAALGLNLITLSGLMEFAPWLDKRPRLRLTQVSQNRPASSARPGASQKLEPLIDSRLAAA